MTTTIGTVTLDRDMVFEDQHGYPLVNASVYPTLGGGAYIQEFQRLEAGRPITLGTGDDQGHQTKATLDALKALADVPNATYTLTVTSNSQEFTRTVRFRNELDDGPIQFEPVAERGGLHGDTVYYQGTLYLMVVGS